MTAFATYLIALPADGQIEPGDDWTDRADRVCELHGRDGWTLLRLLREQPRQQLDWGTHLFEVDVEQLLALYPAEGGLSWFAERDQEQAAALANLDRSQRWGLAVVECY